MADSNKPKAGETANTPRNLQNTALNYSKLQEQNYSTPNKYQVSRVPWILTCDKWLENTKLSKMIAFSVNPENVGWQLKIRGAEVKQRMGSVLHMWRNKIRGTYFDEPRLNIAFQSGNIATYLVPKQNGPFNIEMVRKIPDGLKNFYMFLELVDSQRQYTNAKKETRLNTIYLTYHSNIFPNMTLSGYFDPSAISFSDTSAGGQIESWTATFVVTDSYPKLTGDALGAMALTYGAGENDRVRQVFEKAETSMLFQGEDNIKPAETIYNAREGELDKIAWDTFDVIRSPTLPPPEKG